MGDDTRRFVVRAALTIAKFMLGGALVAGLIGLLLALAAATTTDSGSLTWGFVAPIIWNYVKIGLAGGGLFGLLYGMLTQGSGV